MPVHYGDEHAFEVFCQVGQGESISHVGSVSAPDELLAWQSAKEVYGRRDDLSLLWVVPRSSIIGQDPGDAGALQARKRSPHRQPAHPIKIRKQRTASVPTES